MPEKEFNKECQRKKEKNLSDIEYLRKTMHNRMFSNTVSIYIVAYQKIVKNIILSKAKLRIKS